MAASLSLSLLGEQKKRPRRPVRTETLGKREADSVTQESVQGLLPGDGDGGAVGKMLSPLESRRKGKRGKATHRSQQLREVGPVIFKRPRAGSFSGELGRREGTHPV